MRKSRKDILALIICIECLCIFYCCAGILKISTEHTILRRSASLASVIMACDYKPESPVKAGKEAYEEEQRRIEEEEKRWKGPFLSRRAGTIMGPSGKETYYNLNMSRIVSIMRGMGNTDEYWVREDGCKMLGDYIMVAANFNIRPRGTIVETSLGPGIVVDTGGFAKRNPYQLDLATTW